MGLGDVQELLDELANVKKWTEEVNKILVEVDEKLCYAYKDVEKAQSEVPDDCWTWDRLGEAMDYIDEVSRRLEDI